MKKNRDLSLILETTIVQNGYFGVNHFENRKEKKKIPLIIGRTRIDREKALKKNRVSIYFGNN